ncbi:MAG: carboxypeptidase regulatory-like domain-containing protein, partial [Planctomycetota bacterium]
MKKLVLLASVSLALVSLKAWSFTWDVRAYNGRTAASFDITSTTRANDSVFVNDSEGFNQSNDTVLGVLIDETTTLISGNGWFEVQVQQSLGGPFGSMGLTSLDPPVDGSAGQTWPIVWPSLDYGVLWGLGNQLYFQTNGAYGSLGEGVIFNGDVVRVEVIAPDQVVIKVNGSIVCYFTDTSCSNNPSNTVPSISYPLKPYISARYTGVDVINADASFLSSQPGVISGYIYDQNIQPTPGGAATVFDQSGNFIDHFFVDENGYWETYQLEPGTYYLKTDFANGFINDVWDGAEGTQCPNRLCTVTDWTPVNLGSGDFLTNYDFVLDPIPGGGRRVIGQVTDNVAAPLREVRVIITNNQGGYLTEARTDSSGNYRTGLLPDDDYYVYTGTAPTGFAQEVYDNAVCSPGFTCDDPSVVTAIGTPITIAGADAAADFALDNAVDLGAGVFGQVTGDGLPLADVGVELFDEFGNYYGGRGTAANGDYSFYGLDTDGRTYRLRVNGPPPGYDFELHSNLSCPDNGCDPTTGTPIAVGSEIDVQLDYVGGTPRFYGQVINSDTLQGVSSSIGYMAVNLYDDAGNFIGGVATDAGGRYQFDLTEYERGAGSYFLVTSQDLGYHGLVDEVNDGTPCFGGCNPFDAGATPVVITGGESQRIDFSLQPTLKIRGRITDSATTDPIFDVQVDVWKANGEYVSSARTDGNGDYAVSIPSDGGYFAFTPNYGVPAPYLPEVWDGATGTYCDFQVCDVLTTGTQIGVSGADATGIDFDLDSGFTISGTVFDEGANPIDGVTVCVHRTDGSFAGVCGSSAADGSYSTDALPAGVDYTAYAIGDELGFIREMWDNIECPGSNCDFGIATPIALGPGDATGIDFTLRPSDPGVLRGFILDQNGQPTPGGAVRITDDQNNFYGHVFVDENGYWETWPLPTGTYYLRTDFTNGVIDDVWDDGDGAQCPNGLCNVFDWSPIHLASGDNLGEYTFILDPIGSGGRITGRVEDIGGNGLPLVDVILHNRNGDEFDYARTDLQGNYEFGLQVDETYYVRVQNTPSGLAGELWDNFACLPEIICDGRDNVTANGTAIDVVGADVPGVDFVLEEAPPARVVGQVTDAGNSLPLSGVGVQLFDEFGNYQGGTSTDGDGNYQFLGISDGEYRVYVNGPPEGYQMELYLDVPCPDYSCDFAVDGEPVVVSGGTAVANIALDYVGGPRFMGVVTRSDTGEPVISDFGYMGVNVFNDLNQQVGGTGTDRGGVYQLFVEPGTYYLATDHDRGYHALINECHENTPCENNFDPAGAGALQVPIADGQTIEINFELDPAQTISGTVTATDGGFPIQGVWLDLFDASGNFITNAGTDSLGRYNLLVPGDGEYRVVTSGVPAPYLPESHLDNYCNLGEGCDPVTDGDPVFVSGGNSTTNIDFSLESGFTISGTVFDEGFNPIEGVGVCIHRTDGSWTGVCGGSGPDGTYMTGALPAGVDYTAYAIGDDLGFIREMWDNIECPGSNCDFGIATPIPLGPGDATGIDFTLRPSDPGVLSGYIYDQNLEPTPGGAVAIYDENNEFYGHAWTDENGYWQTWDLPTGTYYLRTQFSNGFIGDVWDGGEGAQCPNGLCNVFDWSPVHLGSGDFLTNIDFVLDPIESGGSISGNVRNEGGEPLAMIRMILMNRNGDYVREVETDPQGNYDFGLQLDETYYVRTGMGPGGLAAELWDDVKCLPEFQCDDRDHVVANGFAINVVGADVPGIDFVLNPAPGRRITGRISDAFTGIPLSDVGVTLYDEFGNWWGGTSSDSTGHYQFLGLPDGLYRVFADGPREGYEAELFQDVPCGDYSCDIVAEGTVVDVTAGNDSADIAMDFAGTRIIGEVKRSDNSAPVPSIFGYMGVNVFDESGNQVGGTGTDRAGVYQLFLEPGTYYLATDHDQGYHGLFNECYNNIPCADNFDPLGAGATPVALAEGQTLEISFFLDPLPAISGTVLVDDGSTVSAAAGEIQALVLTP